MTTYTTTEFLRNSSPVFNDVQALGWVKLVSRNRPDMVLLTQQELDSIISQAKQEHIKAKDKE